MMLYHRFLMLCLCFCAFALPGARACIDSIKVSISPVQCHGLRNGNIRIDSVFGGEGPFYFSIDGIVWSTRPEFERLWAGTYILSVRNPQGCILSEIVEVTEPEQLSVYLEADDYSVPKGGEVNVRAVVYPAYAPLSAISWRPPDMPGISNDLAITTYLSENTTVAITIETPEGCTARDQIYIEVEVPQLYVPNVIQPGSEQNTYFTIYGDWSVNKIQQLQIFDRNGGLVFERTDFWPNDPIQGWNGRRDGKFAAPGVYTWLAQIRFLDGHLEQQQGTVTVVR